MFWTVGFWADSPFFVYENRKEIRMKKKDTNRLIIDNYAFAKIGNRKVEIALNFSNHSFWKVLEI